MSWFGNLFGGKNPADTAMPYLNQIPGQTSPYMQPYFDAGKGALNPLQDQYSQLLNDPGGHMNKIGESYQQSPGFKFALEQALTAAQHSSNAGGMAGTPTDQFNQMGVATGLANQDYNNWMTNALGQYNKGLSGEQGLAQMGQTAGQNLADMIAQTLAQQGNLEFQGQAQQNQNKNDMWGNIFKGAGALSAFTPWGAAGGAMDTAFNRLFK
jgi:hypothetical protein